MLCVSCDLSSLKTSTYSSQPGHGPLRDNSRPQTTRRRSGSCFSSISLKVETEAVAVSHCTKDGPLDDKRRSTEPPIIPRVWFFVQLLPLHHSQFHHFTHPAEVQSVRQIHHDFFFHRPAKKQQVSAALLQSHQSPNDAPITEMTVRSGRGNSTRPAHRQKTKAERQQSQGEWHKPKRQKRMTAVGHAAYDSQRRSVQDHQIRKRAKRMPGRMAKR
jgi:hypothetical protein